MPLALSNFTKEGNIDMFTIAESEKAGYSALILRVALGIMFIAHASLKYFVFTMAGASGFFESIGLPGFMAYVIAIIEVVGGIALILGWFVRPVALALSLVLVGTIIFVHGSKGWLFANEGGGWEYPLFLIVSSVALALLGNGAHALKNPFTK